MTHPTLTITVRGQELTFTSAFADLPQAAAYLRGQPHLSDFARSLLTQRFLSPTQAAWVHRLATERAAEHATPVDHSVPDFTRVVAMLRHASAAQKRFPRITLPDGVTVTLGRGAVFVRAQSATIARIGVETGRVEWRSNQYPAFADALRNLAEHPEQVLAQHGVATGKCCYCGRALSTAESRSVGYGPICAGNYGLPWGDTSVADAANAVASLAPVAASRPWAKEVGA